MIQQRSKGRATVIEDPTLQRDLSTRAVINTDHTDYSRRLALKRSMTERESKLSRLQSEVDHLKNLVTQLISLTQHSDRK
jgi:wobble nucleotide-excising tRNase